MTAYRADIVGSMLRPSWLLEAREQHRAGEISDAEFKRVEDRAVDECIALQEAAGVDVIADGEMRRNVFASQLVQAAEGFEVVSGNTVDWFRLDGSIDTSPVTVGLTGKIRMKRNLSAEEFVYLRARTDKPTKMTIPSPTMYAYYWVPGISDAAYSSTDAYMADVTDILRNEVDQLVALGGTYIQVDAPEFGMLLDPHQQAWFASKGFDPDRMFHDGIDMINAVIDGHPGITFGLHVCRGNDAGRYMARGSYAALASEVFRRTHAERLLLEYDDERSGDFSPLADVPDDKIVVLGLITTKRAAMESADDLVARITEASRYVPLDRLALSPQCGFASVATGNPVPWEIQAPKLQLVADVARRVWND
ncbi:MAG TPA: cobalamin-independent methionine synthase II family protein [Thermomicrobiales bacterium]|nr:cobalamin-independent methionine synthase II family protein [Thermomicrobiales bacterium]